LPSWQQRLVEAWARDPSDRVVGRLATITGWQAPA
jgi:hypothetical protein